MRRPNDVSSGTAQSMRVPSRWGDIALVLALATIPSLTQMRLLLQGPDEALLLVYPEQMAAGRVPGVDFYTLYGPGGFRVLQAGYAAFGPGLAVERTVAIGYHAAIAFAIYLLCRGRGRYAALCAALSGGLLLTLLVPVAYAWMGGLALVLWGLVALMRSQRVAITMLGGVLFGLAVDWRIDLVVAALAALPLLGRRRWLPFVLGFAIGLVPIVTYLLATDFAVLDILRTRVGSDYHVASPRLAGTVWVGVAVCGLSWLAVLRRWLGDVRQRLPLALGLLGLAISPQLIQRVDFQHLVFVGCVLIPFGVAELVAAVRTSSLAARVQGIRVGRLIAVGVMTWVTLQVVLQAPRAAPLVIHEARSLRVSEADRVQFDGVARLLEANVPRGRAVFVGPQNLSLPALAPAWYYHLLVDYRSDFYYLELAPGVSEAPGSPLAQDLGRADALILQDLRAQSTYLFPGIPPGSLVPNQIVTREFCRVGVVGDVAVWVRGTGCAIQP